MTRAPQLDSSDADLSLIAVSPIDRAFAALLSSFVEGFTLFAMAHVSMTPVDESYPSEAKAGQLEQVSARERPKFLTIVSSTQPEVTKSELESVPVELNFDSKRYLRTPASSNGQTHATGSPGLGASL